MERRRADLNICSKFLLIVLFVGAVLIAEAVLCVEAVLCIEAVLIVGAASIVESVLIVGALLYVEVVGAGSSVWAVTVSNVLCAGVAGALPLMNCHCVRNVDFFRVVIVGRCDKSEMIEVD